MGLETTLVEFNLVDKDLFKPIKNLGNKIYVYDGIVEKPDNELIYNTN